MKPWNIYLFYLAAFIATFKKIIAFCIKAKLIEKVIKIARKKIKRSTKKKR